jgi:hypothetical protein
MSNQEPRPKKPPKSKKVNVSNRNQWRKILKEVDKDQVPVHFLDSMILYLNDGTEITIKIREAIEAGADHETLHEEITQRLSKLDNLISTIDFYISIETVNEIVQPITNQILKDL